MKDFQPLVKEYFNFLISQFNFEVAISNDRIVVFQSNQCVVEILHERGQVFINLANPEKKLKYDLGHIVNAVDPHAQFFYKVDSLFHLSDELPRLIQYLKKYCSKLLIGNFDISNRMDEYFAERKNNFKYPKKIGNSKIIYPENETDL